MFKKISAYCVTASVCFMPAIVDAEMRPTIGAYGSAGLIEMPTADMMPDGELSMNYSEFLDAQNVGVSFQFLPQLSMSYRFRKTEDFFGDGESNFDGIWDIQYQLFKETKNLPSVSIGLRDFLATGRTASQYVVATKTIADQLKVTAGAGWGRLSGADELQTDYSRSGGSLRLDEYFNGPVGFFGGLEWKTPVDGVTLKAEYSSDNYYQENVLFGDPVFERKSDFNFGIEYRTKANFSIGAYYLYGSEVGFNLTTSLNPKRGRPQGYIVPAPLPILPADPKKKNDLAWLERADIETATRGALNKILGKDGISVTKINLEARKAEVFVRTGRVPPAQAFGRVARALSIRTSDSIDTFVIGIDRGPFDTVTMTIDRDELEDFEFSPTGVQDSAGAFELADADMDRSDFTEFRGKYPRFSWGVSPSLSVTLFGSGDDPAIRLSVNGNVNYRVSEKLAFGASVSLPFVSTETASGDNVGPDDSSFFEVGELTLTSMYGAYTTKISDNVYAKFAGGLLSSKWGGISGEVLWKPADQRWGVGLDLNYVKQRESGTPFDFLDYDVVTGHASVYYSGRGGFDYELNAGRYLAGDWGATFAIDRRFDNGWRVGVFATLTDLPSEEFGSGRFQKGFRISIPFGWALGTQTGRTLGSTIASTSGEGGSRLGVPGGDLYSSVSSYHIDAVTGSWGTFWK